jgi:hypothetical protein
MQIVDLTRKRDLTKMAHERGYSLRARKPTKNARAHYLRQVRAGFEGDVYHYEVSQGGSGFLCRNLDDVEKIIRHKKSIQQRTAEAIKKLDP